MKRDSVFNPASTKLPEGWDPGKERRYKLDRTAIVIKINNPVYTKAGFQIDFDDCGELCNNEVHVIVYDIVTKYYLTENDLWIFEECLAFNDAKESDEDVAFHIPIYFNIEDLHSCAKPLTEYHIFINQACVMTHAAYIQMLDIFELTLGLSLHYALSNTGLSTYAVDMDRYLRDGRQIINDLSTMNAAEFVLNKVQPCSANVRVELIPARYIVGAFVRWSDRFQIVSAILVENESTFHKLYGMYRTIFREEDYRTIATEFISKMLNLALSAPSENQHIETSVTDRFKEIVKQCVNKLESNFWHSYNTV